MVCAPVNRYIYIYCARLIRSRFFCVPGRVYKKAAQTGFLYNPAALGSWLAVNRAGCLALRALWRVLQRGAVLNMGAFFVAFYGLFFVLFLSCVLWWCFVCLLYVKK